MTRERSSLQACACVARYESRQIHGGTEPPPHPPPHPHRHPSPAPMPSSQPVRYRRSRDDFIKWFENMKRSLISTARNKQMAPSCVRWKLLQLPKWVQVWGIALKLSGFTEVNTLNLWPLSQAKEIHRVVSLILTLPELEKYSLTSCQIEVPVHMM